MIKYKLICKNCDTSFDSWFSSSKEFEKLLNSQLSKVQIEEGKGEKGELKIKYSSYDQLNFIIDKLN